LSVSFGKPGTAFVGKTNLTKAIHGNGFGITTSLDAPTVWQTARKTCREYPERKEWLTGLHGPRIQHSNRAGAELITYGMLTKDQDQVSVRHWALALAKGTGNYSYTLRLAYAKLVSGKIDHIEELEYFLNELEGNLRLLDPNAAIHQIQ
jgi:hypothetical protein